MKQWSDISGWTAFGPYYESVVKDYPGGILVEVGCYLGRSLCLLGELVRKSGKPFTVVGVDTCRGTGVENGRDNHGAAVERGGGTMAGELHRNVVDCGLEGVVTLLVCESAKATAFFADNSLTMCFVDASHDYDSVKRDIQLWLPKVRLGGEIGGDDYGVENEEPVWPGVRRAVDELLRERRLVPHASWAYRKGG